MESRRIVRAGGKEGGQRGGGFVGLARLDPRRRLRERRLGRRLPLCSRQKRRGQRDERRRPDPTGTPPTGNPRAGNPRVGDPHEAESARTPMFPSRRIPGKHRPRRAPDYAVLPAALGLAALLLPGCGDEPPAEAAPEAAPEEILPVGGAIRRPARVRFEPPRYPESARERGKEALVVLELTLDRDGAVAAARSLRGPEDLAAAAVAAARSWAYEPTLVEGEPAALRFAETVRFVLRPAGGQGMRLPAGAGPRESGPPGVPARFPIGRFPATPSPPAPATPPAPAARTARPRTRPATPPPPPASPPGATAKSSSPARSSSRSAPNPGSRSTSTRSSTNPAAGRSSASSGASLPAPRSATGRSGGSRSRSPKPPRDRGRSGAGR